MSEALQPCDPCAVGPEPRCTELRPKHPRFIPQPQHPGCPGTCQRRARAQACSSATNGSMRPVSRFDKFEMVRYLTPVPISTLRVVIITPVRPSLSHLHDWAPTSSRAE